VIAVAILTLALLWPALAGRILVNAESSGSPDAVFVLSGDPLGLRLQTGAEVARSTDSLLFIFLRAGRIHDPRPDVARYIQEQGVAEKRVRFLTEANSTAKEAGVAGGLIRRCKWKKVGVVTSPYHTRRAGWLFRRAVGDKAQVRTIASKEPFNAGRWWANDRDAEVVALEWVKGANSTRYLFRRPVARDPGVPC